LGEGRLRKLRPIHVFTFLAQTLVPHGKKDIFFSCLSLENKLFGARLHRFELRRALAEVGDPMYHSGYVWDYDDRQRFICVLEAYLNAIYSALEITAQINRSLHQDLAVGFRKQSKKFDLFDFSRWSWLARFYDIRSELTHFGSPIPDIHEKWLMIEFRQSKRLEVFNKGKHKIGIDEILEYSIHLFELMDAWATEELKRVDHDAELDSLLETGLHSPLKKEKVKAGVILNLLT
jgi:hypothetical protein